MRLGIVGAGVVGRATARAFMGFCEVAVFDVIKERATHALDDVLASEITMICLPTPQKEGSLECDLSAVNEFFSGFEGDSRRTANLVLRSTVPVGTTRRLREQYDLPNLVHSPEFLSARTAALDAQMPARNVVGYKPGDQVSMAVRDRLVALYQSRWPHIPVHVMASDESEAVKLFQNAAGAVTVSLWNEFRAFADARWLDWDAVYSALMASGWFTGTHTRVPGPDGKRGFSGACLPKDLASLVHQLGEYGMVCNAALRRNEAVDRRRDA